MSAISKWMDTEISHPVTSPVYCIFMYCIIKIITLTKWNSKHQFQWHKFQTKLFLHEMFTIFEIRKKVIMFYLLLITRNLTIIQNIIWCLYSYKNRETVWWCCSECERLDDGSWVGVQCLKQLADVFNRNILKNRLKINFRFWLKFIARLFMINMLNIDLRIHNQLISKHTNWTFQFNYFFLSF